MLNNISTNSHNVRVDHAKMLMFLSRNACSSACSSGLVSVPRQMALSGTLESKGTFMNSPSASMDFLYFAGASALRGHADC
jgi:hypothetical protein